jgi:hypothetical protein
MEDVEQGAVMFGDKWALQRLKNRVDWFHAIRDIDQDQFPVDRFELFPKFSRVICFAFLDTIQNKISRVSSLFETEQDCEEILIVSGVPEHLQGESFSFYANQLESRFQCKVCISFQNLALSHLGSFDAFLCETPRYLDSIKHELVAASLSCYLQELGLKSDIYAMGTEASKVASILSSHSEPESSYETVSVVLFDRELDLLTPCSFPLDFLDAA